jgi:prefoldin subunit 5
MTEPTRIERRSLEAHVELCAKRYSYLESKMESLDEKITKVESVVDQMYELLSNNERKHNDRLINWGVGIITSLIGVLAWVVTTFVFKS